MSALLSLSPLTGRSARFSCLALNYLRGPIALIAQCLRSDFSSPVLRDTARLSQRYPLLHPMGFLVAQHDQFGAKPPSPFFEPFPSGK